MATALRLAAATVFFLLGCEAVFAQPQVTPPPQLALDELVKEYKRCGLPVPPPEAELVRVKWYLGDKPCFLALRYPPTKPLEIAVNRARERPEKSVGANQLLG